MKYLDLELDNVQRYIRLDKKEFEITFHEFADIVYQYTLDNDPKIFDDNKSRILKAHRYYSLGDKTNLAFFRKISKIRFLHNEFLQNNHKWTNPLIVRKITPGYLCHPGADRIQVMKYYGVKTYPFMILENHEFSKPIASRIISRYYTGVPEWKFWFDPSKNWFKFASTNETYSNTFLSKWLQTEEPFLIKPKDIKNLILDQRIKRKSS